MKISSKLVLSVIAFSTIIGLQAFVVYQQNQANQSLQAKVNELQNQVNSLDSTNAKLLSKVEKIENDLESKPRQLLSMN
ncbi:hypothetical protein [Bowmanella pacifica]|uniref:Uncharacterized protein n=1 Tax=Bowmanella pacifica TaxID=502051 RepID=A0A918DJQ9_9ALTE|nr:hypothetical protein [Bowmanella pacifica]GGO70793.1 hypothetical protein GCM10010982_25150 [Bowmanella pacifica]